MEIKNDTQLITYFQEKPFYLKSSLPKSGQWAGRFLWKASFHLITDPQIHNNSIRAGRSPWKTSFHLLYHPLNATLVQYGPVDQLEDRHACNVEARGSNPLRSILFYPMSHSTCLYTFFAYRHTRGIFLWKK